MGYYTTYKLSIYRGDTVGEFTCQHCNSKVNMSIIDILKNDLPNIPFDENQTKWYDHEDDMKHISKRYPNTVFRLDGRGEEQGDVWIKFFSKGKMVVRKAIVQLDESAPEFNYE
jgi:hypothetical protein